MRSVDLNCDLGEGGSHDAELMALITSANIACGGHAGDEATMSASVALALKHGVAIGAHPGFADPGFMGRREIAVTPGQVAELVLGQTQILQAVAQALGAGVHHVKLHGALYHQVSRDAALAAAVVQTVARPDMPAVLYVLAGSELERVARLSPDITVVSEVFADRTYQADGALTPRSEPDALITDEVAAVTQVLRLVTEGRAAATDGSEVAMRAETVCLHGDGAHAAAFARRLRAALGEAGCVLRVPGGGQVIR